MRNPVLGFDRIAVIDLTKGTNSFNLTFRAHKSKRSLSKGLEYFPNISIYMKIQWLKFGYMAMFDLLNISNDVDHDGGSHKVKKMKNRTIL